MSTFLVLAGFGGLAIIGAAIWRDGCDDIARLISERRDLKAENEFLKLTDDELAELIISDLRRAIILN
ncbi:hypothetical protein [Ensifer sp. Root558]|uniref:hypothetical protein n=1 Tax=Ensifer sp. Root558 TaxID=1736558 RepID=UPI000712568C|nr:hypothetical protein [Ensifer sp. Root558]KQZ41819.1 hypothetical protein ASD63_16600 [Ensifer sp. Root558]